MAGDQLHEWVRVPHQLQMERVADGGRAADPGHAAEVLDREIVPEPDRDVADRCCSEIVDGFGGDDAPVADDRHPLAEVLDLVEHVGRQEHRGALGDDLAAEGLELPLDEWIESRGRLVQHDQLGPVHERRHQRDLLPVPTRQVVDRPVEIDAEAGDEPVEVRARSTVPRSRANQPSSSRAVIRS